MFPRTASRSSWLHLENVRDVLARAGFEHVVDMTAFHTSLEGLPLFAEMKACYFTSQPTRPGRRLA